MATPIKTKEDLDDLLYSAERAQKLAKKNGNSGNHLAEGVINLIKEKRATMNIINLILGDWSHDGHGLSETFTIESNLTFRQVAEALEKGENMVDVVLDNMAEGYEEPFLEYEDWVKLNTHGLTVKMLLSNSNHNEEWITNKTQKAIDDEDFIVLHEESFLNIFFFLVQKGNPDFQYKILKDENPSLKLGGYGLYQ